MIESRPSPGPDTLRTRISVVVVNWNTRELLRQCLDSLSASLEQGDIEVWVVDNHSMDGSAQDVRVNFPWVKLIENSENLGFAAANNQAMRKASGQYLLLLNNDTIVEPGALEELAKFMDGYPRAGGAGARLLNADGSLQPSCHPMLTPEREFWRLIFLDRVWPRVNYPMRRWNPSLPHRVEVIKGACLMLRRKALDQAGLFDERYFMYTEEVDLCYRLAAAGWELWWVPSAAIVHYEGQSSKQAAAQMYVQLYRSKVQFYRKFGSEARATRYKWLVRLAYWPRLVVAAMGKPFSPSLSVRRDTIRQLLNELGAM